MLRAKGCVLIPLLFAVFFFGFAAESIKELGDASVMVCCKCFNMEKVVTKKGGKKKKLKLLHMKTNFAKFIQTLKPKLQLYMT